MKRKTPSLPLHVVILAAGLGKRMHSDLPKVLQPLAGRPLLDHVIERAGSLKAERVHVVHGHGGEQVKAALGDAPVDWVEQAEQLGTGHAVAQAMPRLRGEAIVLVLYGDVPLIEPATLRKLIRHAGQDALALLTVELDDPTGYGRIVRDGSGRVSRIVEQRDATRAERALREVNTGLLACPASKLRRWLKRLDNDNAQGEYYLTDIVELAVRGRVPVQAVRAGSVGEVLGVNDKRQLAELEAEYRRRRADALLAQGVTLIDPLRVDVRGPLRCGRDVSIDVNVVFEGEVRLGDRVRIGPNVVIRDSRIGDDTEVHANCVIERSFIGPRCGIGPFARVRPETQLAGEVRLGNFVEVKKSDIGPGSKVNHLTYIGDTTIGRDVNVGAGTVTCNYDGANKYRTEIGDRAFIGSGTMLVAPVSVGADATIGAGSTVTRPAPAGQLTVARARQATIEGWQRPVKGQPKTAGDAAAKGRRKR